MTRRSRMLIPTVAVGLLAVAVIAVALALRQRAADDAADTARPADDVATFVTLTGEAALVDAERITVEASSHLPPAEEVTYDPGNTIDRDPLTAWNSDSPEADGRGESLTFRFSEPVDLKGVRFIDGYAKNPEIFEANHRLRSVVVSTDQSNQMLTLLDTSDAQEIRFDFGVTSKVVLEVVDIYPGDGFANPELTADLAVSEVSFLAVQR
ncbi:MAG: NADase-type glycan-binding domain-containing protein [Acidimicrobiales bacterium]